MADQNTTNYGFVKPEIGASEDTWGEKLNSNWDDADTAIKSLEDGKVNNTGNESIAGVKTFSDGIISNVTGNVTGNLTGDAATLNGLTAAQIFPSGLISMWSGTNASIPSGWALCDGNNGTPDLHDRFIMGDTSDARGAGGSSHTATSSTNGSHSHGGATASHTLTVDQMPSHRHSISGFSFSDSGDGYIATGSLSSSAIGDYTDYTGGNAGHTHGIGADGNHNHTVDTRGKYYKLAFIMKL
jgi:hypothetical protein